MAPALLSNEPVGSEINLEHTPVILLVTAVVGRIQAQMITVVRITAQRQLQPLDLWLGIAVRVKITIEGGVRGQ